MQRLGVSFLPIFCLFSLFAVFELHETNTQQNHTQQIYLKMSEFICCSCSSCSEAIKKSLYAVLVLLSANEW